MQARRTGSDERRRSETTALIGIDRDNIATPLIHPERQSQRRLMTDAAVAEERVVCTSLRRSSQASATWTLRFDKPVPSAIMR